MQKERIHWIDVARGIGIIFVIYSHVLGSRDFRHLIYAFHMPFFFFLSGILYKNSEGFMNVLKKSARKLLIPYFTIAFLTYFFWFFNLNSQNISPEVIRQFLSIFYANSNNGMMAFNIALWFLPTLFVTRVLFALIVNIFKKTQLLIFILLLFSVFGYLFSIYLPNVKLPFGAEVALSAVVFYGAGFLWQQSEKTKEFVSKHRYFLFPALIIFGAILAIIDFNNYGHQIDMRLGHLNNYFFFYTGAFSGIFAWIAFSMILKKNSLLETIGKNALILFAWHSIVFIYLRRIITSEIMGDAKIFIPFLYTLISISTILLVNFILKKLRSGILLR